LLEVAHRELMRCLAGAGEPGRAARHYTELVDRLRDDLGVAPTAQTTALYRQLTGRRRQTLSAC
jgi:DNA-binding SARP family transcriptional activator